GDTRILPIRTATNRRITGLGTTQRLFTEGQRLALIARDLGCSFPGCDAPPQYCEAHHVTAWAEGGLTAIDNGALLCGPHHDHFEAWGWRCQMIDGIPHYHSPHGGGPIRNRAHNPRPG
ncbi:MAG: HNH endonuclease signature motif containing protein, partial [Trebonia sp.]